jgi:hypothetical protein
MVVEGTVSPHSLLLQVHTVLPSMRRSTRTRRGKNFPFYFFLSFYIPNTKELVSALDHHLMCRRRLCLLAATTTYISPSIFTFLG